MIGMIASFLAGGGLPLDNLLKYPDPLGILVALTI